MRRAVGLMSGTSMDGIDLAVVETDGLGRVRRGPVGSLAYEPAFRRRLKDAVTEARRLTDRRARPGSLAAVERDLTDLHAETFKRFIGSHALQPSAIDVVGFHGQTVLHRPEQGLTVQIGDGARLAELIGVDVVYDMRAADVAAGGQGAPLVPVYHRALVDRIAERPVAIVNIGGVANITFVARDGHLIAFDTGPGNALIDDWMMQTRGEACDEDGALAATGAASAAHVTHYLRHSHFAAPPPKSLDRDAFPLDLVGDLSPADGAATLTRLTAESIARAREHFPEEPALWIVTGGGRRNRTLMGELAGLVENAVVPAEAVGLDGDSLEAEAWAYLAVRALDGAPITFPGTTGVSVPTTGGVLARAPH